MGRKHLGLIAFMLIPGLLSACQLLPEEEVLPAAPVIRDYEAEDYKYVTVMRGDLISTTNITTYYALTKKQNLSFPLGGMYIDTVNVTVGQQVKTGDVLASLEQEDMQARLSAQRHEINVLNKQSKHLKETLELELSQYSSMLVSVEQQLQQLQAAVPTEEEADSVQQQIDALLLQKESLEQRSTSAQNNYDQQMETINDSLYVAYLRMDELNTTLENRMLIAGMDGVVTYVEELVEGQRSVGDQRFITVADLASAAFTVDAKYASYLPIGTEVTITCNKQEQEAVVVDAADLGIDVSDTEEPVPVYLKLKEPDPSLEDYDKGTLNLILEQRSDVLYVQKEAIQNADSDPFVYLMDEDGLRTMQSVTTGMSTDEFVEIVAGLSEGDYVIVE